MKKIAILGSTGSIGINTLEVIKRLPKSQYNVTALSAQRNIKLLEKQIVEFKPRYAAVADFGSGKMLETQLKSLKLNTKIYIGPESLNQIIEKQEINFILNSIVGAAGLIPLITAIEHKKNIALANKEPLVIAGDIVMKIAKKNNVFILPVDSEHSTIFQCINRAAGNEIKKIVLTASGGPFYKLTKPQLNKVTVKQTLNHPSWVMGKKITVDSATLMNKGFEVIEAHHLFNMPVEKIGIVIHPQSIIHSMVEYIDGNILALLSIPDMRLPIQYALTYPSRVDTNLPRLDWCKSKKLEFQPLNLKRFPCLELALESIHSGGSAPAVLNAANEIAVDSFLKQKIRFNQISKIIEKVMMKHKVIKNPDLDTILYYDKWSRDETERIIGCC